MPQPQVMPRRQWYAAHKQEPTPRPQKTSAAPFVPSSPQIVERCTDGKTLAWHDGYRDRKIAEGNLSRPPGLKTYRPIPASNQRGKQALDRLFDQGYAVEYAKGVEERRRESLIARGIDPDKPIRRKRANRSFMERVQAAQEWVATHPGKRKATGGTVTRVNLPAFTEEF